MWQLAVTLCGSLGWIGVAILVLAFRPRAEDMQEPAATKFPGVRLLDWTSGWLMMLGFCLTGVSATAVWFRFNDPLKSMFFVALTTAEIFAPMALLWFLVKRASARRESKERAGR